MRSLVLILALLAGAAEAAEKKTDVRLLRIGSFHGEEVKAESGEKWLALRKKEGGYALEEVEIAVDPVFDAVLDYDTKNPDDKSKQSGREVSILGEDKSAPGYEYPIILMRGDSLKPGPVETAFPTTQHQDEAYRAPGSFAPRSSIWLTLGKYHYQLSLLIEWSWKEQPEDKCELTLSTRDVRKGANQVLAKQFPMDYDWRAEKDRKMEAMACLVGDGFPELAWAGDLDHDGKLDLLLSPNYHYNVGSIVLFLSGKAGEGDLVKRVAEFTSTGC